MLNIFAARQRTVKAGVGHVPAVQDGYVQDQRDVQEDACPYNNLHRRKIKRIKNKLKKAPRSAILGGRSNI